MPASKKAPAAKKAAKKTATKKVSSDRVRELRERREAFGLKRLDVYVHPDDHAKVKALVEKLLAARGWP